MLSHYNLISQIEAIAQLFWIDSSDRIVGVLPFFHSFGFTVTIWFPLLSGCGVVYHPNPTDARAVGELVQKHKATLLLTTPDLLRHLHAQVLRRRIRQPALRPGGRRETAPDRRRRLPRKVRRRAARRLRLHRDVAGRRRQRARTSAPARTRKPATSPAPWATRCPASPRALSIPSPSTRCRPIRKACCW